MRRGGDCQGQEGVCSLEVRVIEVKEEMQGGSVAKARVCKVLAVTSAEKAS